MLTGFNHYTIATGQVDRSFKFYRDILGLQPILKWPQGAYLLCGQDWFCINHDDRARKEALPEYTHLAFTVSQDKFEILSQKIKESKTQLFQKNSSEGESLYFLDPDGHKIEIHVGNWKTRLAYFQTNPKPEMEFFTLDQASNDS